MTQIDFLGAAQTVTGSLHLVRSARANILLDCGLFQGRRRESFERNRHLPIDPKIIDAVVLSHAHMDHSGALPLLSRLGYQGPIYCTAPTRSLCTAMLMDAAMIQASDARYINRAIERDGSDMEPVEPLYEESDVVQVLKQIVGLPYGFKHPIAPGVQLTLLDAGHVLGSAIVVLDLEDTGERIAFTGDLGRQNMPILRDPEVPHDVDYLIMESTYGDRLHEPIASMDHILEETLRRTFARGGKVFVPSFALERAQELILAFKRLKAQNKMPPMPVYLDSPLAVKITDVFRLYPDCYDADLREKFLGKETPFDFEGLHYVSDVEESKAISALQGPAVIIAGSGMVEGGRILHHLRTNVEDNRNTIIIVGFQAQHTLGRRIVEKRLEIKIFGLLYSLRAEVVVLNGYSAHADQHDLLLFARSVAKVGKLKDVFLVHGEPAALSELQQRLYAMELKRVRVPKQGETFKLE
jgi:metallo-beta-lactamase family protein